MIMNPVIQGSGAEKVYKITNPYSISFPEKATTGSFVRAYRGPEKFMGIRTIKSQEEIPYMLVSGTYVFVMPASDVEIY